MILVATGQSQERPDVGVDRLDLPEGDLLVAGSEDPVEMPEQRSWVTLRNVGSRCHRSARSHIVRNRRTAPS